MCQQAEYESRYLVARTWRQYGEAEEKSAYQDGLDGLPPDGAEGRARRSMHPGAYRRGYAAGAAKRASQEQQP